MIHIVFIEIAQEKWELFPASKGTQSLMGVLK
jgi:hypothetical protein